jgi:hypothetical protein
MNVEAMKVDAQVVVSNGVDAMDKAFDVGPGLGPGPVFTGPRESAAFVQTRDGGFSADAEGNAQQADQMFGKETTTPTDNVADGTSNQAGTTKNVTKLEKMHDLIMKNTMDKLKTFRIESIITLMQTNPWAHRRQLLCTKILNTLMGFDLSKSAVSTAKDPDFTLDTIIPFHIIALVCLLVDTSKKSAPKPKAVIDKCLSLIKEVKKHITEMCEDPDAVKEVTEHAFKEHAKTFHATYHRLLQMKTDSTEDLERRDQTFEQWILKIKKNAAAYLNLLRMQLIMENMQETLFAQQSDSDGEPSTAE